MIKFLKSYHFILYPRLCKKSIKDIKADSIDDLITLDDRYGIRYDGGNILVFVLCVQDVKKSFSDVDKSQMSVEIIDSLMHRFKWNGWHVSDALEHMMENEPAYQCPINKLAPRILEGYPPSKSGHKEIRTVLAKWGNDETKKMCTDILSHNQQSHGEKELQRRQQGNPFSMNK